MARKIRNEYFNLNMLNVQCVYQIDNESMRVSKLGKLCFVAYDVIPTWMNVGSLERSSQILPRHALSSKNFILSVKKDTAQEVKKTSNASKP